MNTLLVDRGKRPWSVILPSSSKLSFDFTQMCRFPWVLQGQEVMTLGEYLDDNDMESGQNIVA